jgi:hypothetical protein
MRWLRPDRQHHRHHPRRRLPGPYDATGRRQCCPRSPVRRGVLAVAPARRHVPEPVSRWRPSAQTSSWNRSAPTHSNDISQCWVCRQGRRSIVFGYDPNGWVMIHSPGRVPMFGVPAGLHDTVGQSCCDTVGLPLIGPSESSSAHRQRRRHAGAADRVRATAALGLLPCREWSPGFCTAPTEHNRSHEWGQHRFQTCLEPRECCSSP